MALFRYFKPQDGLPDPRGTLSTSILPTAIAQANREVQKTTGSNRKKRGPYKRYSASVRAAVGKYASQHGVAAAACYFPSKLGECVSETHTVRSIRSADIEGMKRTRTVELDKEQAEIIALPSKERGRPVLLGQKLDSLVQMYLTKVKEAGGAVSERIAMAAARGILLKYDCTMLVEFGGHIELNWQWNHSPLKRMKFVQRKVTTAKSKESEADFIEQKKCSLLMF